MSDKPDSPIWTNPAVKCEWLEQLGPPTPEAIAKWRAIIESPEYKAELARRLAPYQTRVTRRRLETELD